MNETQLRQTWWLVGKQRSSVHLARFFDLLSSLFLVSRGGSPRRRCAGAPPPRQNKLRWDDRRGTKRLQTAQHKVLLMKLPCCENVIPQEVVMELHPHEYAMTQPSRDCLAYRGMEVRVGGQLLTVPLVKWRDVMVLTVTPSGLSVWGQYMTQCNVEFVASLEKWCECRVFFLSHGVY